MNAAMPRRHTSPPPPLAAVPAAPSDTLAACTRSLSSPPAVRKDRLSQIDCRWQSTCESDEMARFNKQLRRSQTDSNPAALPLVARVLSGTCGQRQAARDSKPMPPCASRARSYQPTNTHHASTCKPRDSQPAKCDSEPPMTAQHAGTIEQVAFDASKQPLASNSSSREQTTHASNCTTPRRIQQNQDTCKP